MCQFNRWVLLLAVFIGTSSASAQELWEGSYQIGAHRCTVTPIRMAFDVQCPKDSPASGIYAYAPKINHDGDIIGPPRFERSAPQPGATVTFENADLKLGLWSSAPQRAKKRSLSVLKIYSANL